MVESEFCAAVGAPGKLVVTGVCGAFFAVADGLDASGINSAFSEGIANGLSAEFSEGDVEFVGAAFIAVAFDHQDDGRVCGKELDNGVEFSEFHGRNDGLAVIEIEWRDIGGRGHGGKLIEPEGGEGRIADTVEVVVFGNEIAASNGIIETGVVVLGAPATGGKEESEGERREKKSIGFHLSKMILKQEEKGNRGRKK